MKESSKKHLKTPFQIVQGVLQSHCWDKLLKVEQVPLSQLIRVLRPPKPLEGYDAEVVALYEMEQIVNGEVTPLQIQFDCRKFLVERNLIR